MFAQTNTFEKKQRSQSQAKFSAAVRQPPLLRVPSDLVVHVSQFLMFGDLASLARCCDLLRSLLSLKQGGQPSPALSRRQVLDEPTLTVNASESAHNWLFAHTPLLHTVALPRLPRTKLLTAIHAVASNPAGALRLLFDHSSAVAADCLVAIFRSCVRLRSLRLGALAANVSAGALPVLANLQCLEVGHLAPAHAALLLPACPNLIELKVSTRSWSAVAAMLSGVRKLRVLDVWITGAPVQLADLARASHLQTLCVRGDLGLPDTPMVCLPGLCHLHLGTVVDAQHWSNVQLPSLRRLEVWASQLRACALPQLMSAAMPNLRVLRAKPVDCHADEWNLVGLQFAKSSETLFPKLAAIEFPGPSPIRHEIGVQLAAARPLLAVMSNSCRASNDRYVRA
jgi:hypothetical protein